MDPDKIKRGVELMLEGIGEDLGRKGLLRTPERVAEMCREIFSGVSREPSLKGAFAEPAAAGSIIRLRKLDFYSICEHHLLPFFGVVEISYRPDRMIAGFSGFSRLVDDLSRRPQIQERLTAQIADTIMKELEPSGVQVVTRATQLCTCMRGDHRKRMQTICEILRGSLDQTLNGNVDD